MHSERAETQFGLATAEVKRRHILGKAIAVGAAAGVMASAFRMVLEFIEHHRLLWQAELSRPWALVVAVALGAAGGGASVWLVRRKCPEAAGAGIPHLKSVLVGGPMFDWKRLLPVKFLAGLASCSSGMALGREGPTVQMGGATGLMVSEWLRVKRGEGERKALISAGAAAGLSAAFNAPLAGVVFVLEELQGNFTPVVFVGAFLASVTGDVVGRLLVCETCVFTLPQMAPPTVAAVPVALVLGAVCGLGGVLFNRVLLKGLDLFESLVARRPFLAGAVVGLCAGAAGWVFPLVAGSGVPLAEEALTGHVAVWLLPGLIVARFFLTMLSYSSGAAGGMFAPILVLGSLGGLAMGTWAHGIAPSLAASPPVFAVLGMGALLTATIRAPLTAIILMVELTGEYRFMLPLLACCLAAYGVAEWCRDVPIYEALRERARRLGSGPAPAGS